MNRRALHRLASRMLVVALLVVLAGCQAILPLFYPAEKPLAAAKAPPIMATIALTVHWPTGPGRDFRGYHAQLIPDSTATVVATVYNGTTAIGSTSKTRTVSQTSVTIPVTVPVGDGYNLEVLAYPGTNAPPATAGAIARATAAGINTLGLTLATQHTLPVDVTLTSLYVPAITGMSSQAGNVNQTVQLTGTDLAPDWEIALPKVYFNGTAAVTVTRQNSGTITATVPTGATTGNIMVKADGVESVSTARYWVVSSQAVTTTSPAINANAVANGLVYYGGTLDYTATLTFALKSGETLATYTGRPAVAWTVSGASHTIATQGDTAGTDTVTSVGRLTAAGGYSSGLAVATLGTATANHLARSVGVDSVSVSPSSFTINALPPVGQSVHSSYLAGTTRAVTATVTHTLPFSEGVSWTTSHSELVAANQTISSATITTTQGAVAASRTFTATSITDAAAINTGTAKASTGNVTITDLGLLLLGVQ
ncbi:MAG: hypothetical protein FJZ01_20630 [Candidatus Sericytochromatia bacterium]|nr:hypothetical protein [Candidatus Tanganyikabacteria bacterium]